MKMTGSGVIVAPNPHIPDHHYSGDKFECPSCGHIIVSGFGLPHHDPDVQADLTLRNTNEDPFQMRIVFQEEMRSQNE